MMASTLLLEKYFKASILRTWTSMLHVYDKGKLKKKNFIYRSVYTAITLLCIYTSSTILKTDHKFVSKNASYSF